MNPGLLWNERFTGEGYKYGTAPNAFLAAQACHVAPGGAILSLGEGEGRNAVWLAGRGYSVHAYDASDVALSKLAALAAQRAVTVEATFCDLADADLGTARWDGIVNVYCHLPSALRLSLYPRIDAALRPGGVFITEQFAPDQLQYQSGGPKSLDMLPDLAELKAAFPGYTLRVAAQEVVELEEGPGHQGPGAVIRLVAVKPTQA